MLVVNLFFNFYYTCVRQEVDGGSQDVNLFLLKRAPAETGFYEVTEDQFRKLLVVCRGFAEKYPGTLWLDEQINYHDSLYKVVGKHDFWDLTLSNDQLKESVARYFPEEVE